MPDTASAYSQPLAFELDTVGEVSDSDGICESVMLVVWRHIGTGRLYWQTDNLHSDFDNDPFDWCTELSDLHLVDPGNWVELQEELQAFVDSKWFGSPWMTQEAAELLERVTTLISRS